MKNKDKRDDKDALHLLSFSSLLSLIFALSIFNNILLLHINHQDISLMLLLWPVGMPPVFNLVCFTVPSSVRVLYALHYKSTHFSVTIYMTGYLMSMEWCYELLFAFSLTLHLQSSPSS